MSKAISRIQKARKALDNGDGRCPNACEIAKFTGLSLAKIESANKCLRVVGSINQPFGQGIDAKFWVRVFLKIENTCKIISTIS